MKKNSLLLLAWLGILVPLASFAISSPINFWWSQNTNGAELYRDNPSDGDFSHIELRRSIVSHPLTINDGDFVISGTQTSYQDTGALDGTNYYSIFAVDLSGNVSDRATDSVGMDLTGPVFTSPSSITGVVLGLGWVIAYREVSDPSYIDTFTYKIINTNNSVVLLDLQADPDPTTTTYTGELWLDKAFIDVGGTGGNYMFEYVATDIYGNYSTGQLAFVYDPEYIADTTWPTVSDLLPSSGQLVPGDAPFSWTVSDPTLPGGYLAFAIAGDIGLTQVAYQAGIFFTELETTQTVGGDITLADGNYYRWSTVYDYLDNETSTPSTPFTVDATAPIITYTSPIADGGSILSGENAILSSESYDLHLSGWHIHTYIGTAANFDQTRPTNGLYHGGNAPYDTTSQGSLSLSNLPVGTYYWYAEVSDVVGNYTSWAMQSFTVLAPAPRRSGGGGGAGTTSKIPDNCTATDLSPSEYDGLCFNDAGIPITHRTKLIKLLNPNATPSDTGATLTVAGFIRDVFTLLDIPFHGTMPEAYNTPISEKLFNKLVKRLLHRLNK